MTEAVDARMIGGVVDGLRARLIGTPPRVRCAGRTYVRLDDPDTGEFLGGYALVPED